MLPVMSKKKPSQPSEGLFYLSPLPTFLCLSFSFVLALWSPAALDSLSALKSSLSLLVFQAAVLTNSNLRSLPFLLPPTPISLLLPVPQQPSSSPCFETVGYWSPAASISTVHVAADQDDSFYLHVPGRASCCSNLLRVPAALCVAFGRHGSQQQEIMNKHPCCDVRDS